jgi:hypothetical protein
MFTRQGTDMSSTNMSCQWVDVQSVCAACGTCSTCVMHLEHLDTHFLPGAKEAVADTMIFHLLPQLKMRLAVMPAIDHWVQMVLHPIGGLHIRV